MTSDHVVEAHALLAEFRSRDEQAEIAAFWTTRLPADDDRRRGLAEAFDRIGVEAFNDDRPDAARDAFWPLLLLRLAHVKVVPDDRAAIRDFASAEDLLGLALLRLGRLAPAEQMLTEAHRYRAGLWRDEPSDPHAAFLYGVALWHMAKLERAKGDGAAEVEWSSKARQHLKAVDAERPEVSFIVDELGAVEERLGEIRMARPDRSLLNEEAKQDGEGKPTQSCSAPSPVPGPAPGLWQRVKRLFS